MKSAKLRTQKARRQGKKKNNRVKLVSASTNKHESSLTVKSHTSVNYCIISRKHTDAQICEVRAYIKSVISS